MLPPTDARVRGSSSYCEQQYLSCDSAATLVMAPLQTLSHFMDTCTITPALMYGSMYFGGTVHASYSEMMEERFIVELIAE